jgi:hypothetical protein
MGYLTTTYENFGVIEEVDSLPEYCEVVGDIAILSFIQRQKPHLVSFDFDGERAYTEHPEELAKFTHNIKGSYKNYRFIFIPVKA